MGPPEPLELAALLHAQRLALGDDGGRAVGGAREVNGNAAAQRGELEAAALADAA